MADFSKTKNTHLCRKAFLYIRQSTLRQVHENTESTKRQYALKERLIGVGWDEARIEVIDSDLGQSGAESEGRRGFQYLVSEVSLGHVGIIAGIEVSRLSRSSSDWNKLLQIAALSDTLIMDEDGIYNVNEFNDRLLLGLKGTLSEAELHYLKARMRGGLLNKAKRGELKRFLSIGYIYDDDGQIIKDPDAGVQQSIMTLFNTFKRVGSVFGVVREYEKLGILFPFRQCRGLKLGELSWVELRYTTAIRIFKNPLYAGIYTYGMYLTQHTVNGTKQKKAPREQYHAWLPNSHSAYISEGQFEENNRQITANAHPRYNTEHSGAVREGSSLLQGIAICGKCGKGMTIKYSKSNLTGQPLYICGNYSGHPGEGFCQRVAGGNVDITIEKLLLETINPMMIESAVSIQQEMTARKEEILLVYSQQAERARYDMELAKRRYLRVDPDNRLVAAELERDWEQKVSDYESAKMAYEQKCETEVRIIDDKLKLALEQLVSDFPQIWNDPQTSNKDKKRIARHILEDVTITAEHSKIVLGVRFKGDATKVIQIPKTMMSLDVYDMEPLAVEDIRQLRPLGMTYQEMADILNKKGYKFGVKGRSFDDNAVRQLIRKYNLPKCLDIFQEAGWLTLSEKMAELGVSRYKLYTMQQAGELVYKRCNLPGRPCLFAPEHASQVSVR